jgi:DNA-binding MarR family transcriptional regulator
MSEKRSSLPAVLPCTCANLRRASRAITQVYDDALRDTGLRATQFTLLQSLSLAGELTQGELGEFLAIDTTTLTRTLLPLEGRGWIRSRPGADRRERYWAIAAAGEARLKKAQPAWEKAQRRMRNRIGDKRLSLLLDDLALIVAAAS